MVRPVYSSSLSALQELAALRKEARLCRQVAACLSMHEERARMLRRAECYEGRASALAADVQDEMLQTLDVEGATVAW